MANKTMRFSPLLYMLLFVIFFSVYGFAKERQDTISKQRLSASKKPTLIYGINVDGFKVHRGFVKSRQSLIEILRSFKVSYSVIYSAAAKAKKIFDVQDIKSGNPYTIITNRDSDNTVRYFVYEQTPLKYVVFDLGDPVYVYTGSKTVETKTRTACGTIKSSLWDAFKEQRLDYRLFLSLSELYARTINFRHLRKGDRFKVIFEQKYAEGESIGPSTIKAAKFTHDNKNLFAFFFQQKECNGYFDENGENLQRAFLRAPIKYSRVSSGFSRKRFHPVLGIRREHLGIDYAAPMGTPVLTVGDGVILKTGFNRSAGKFVKVRHNRTFMSQYLHMSGFAVGIIPGVRVKQGDIIGYVGSTGLTTGPNLDFRFWKNDKPVNFFKIDLPEGESIKEGCRHIFKQQIADLKTRLNIDNHPTALKTCYINKTEG